MIKFAAVIGIIFIVIWFIASVVVPLLVINLASIALAGAMIFKPWRKPALYASVLAAIYLFVDYNIEWATQLLAESVAFFQEWIKPMLYLNLFSGLTASYFMIREALDTRNPPPNGMGEFSKRNIAVIGGLLVFGMVVVGMQQYADTQTVIPNSFSQGKVVPHPGPVTNDVVQ